MLLFALFLNTGAPCMKLNALTYCCNNLIKCRSNSLSQYVGAEFICAVRPILKDKWTPELEKAWKVRIFMNFMLKKYVVDQTLVLEVQYSLFIPLLSHTHYIQELTWTWKKSPNCARHQPLYIFTTPIASIQMTSSRNSFFYMLF